MSEIVELSKAVRGRTHAVLFVDVQSGCGDDPRTRDVTNNIVDWMDTYGMELAHFVAVLHAKDGVTATADAQICEAGVGPTFIVARHEDRKLAARGEETTLQAWLAERTVDVLLLGGVGTDTGISSLAAEAIDAGLTVGVLTDLSVGATPERHAAALRALADAGALVGVYDPEHLHGAREVSVVTDRDGEAAVSISATLPRFEEGTIDRAWTVTTQKGTTLRHRPVAFEEMVIVQFGNAMAAYEARSGTTRWRTLLGSADVWSCEALILIDEDVFSAVTPKKNGEVAAVHARSGAVQWQVEVEGEVKQLSSGGIADPEGLWVRTERGPTATHLHRLDRRSGRQTASMRCPRGTRVFTAVPQGIVLGSGMKKGLFVVDPRAAKLVARPVRDELIVTLRRGEEWIFTSTLVGSGFDVSTMPVVIEAIDPASMASVWKHHGEPGSPDAFEAEGGQVVLAGPDAGKAHGTVVLRDERSGDIVWTSKRLELSIGSVHFGGPVIVVTGFGPAIVLDRATGAHVGSLGRDAAFLTSGAAFIGALLITSDADMLHAFRLPA